MAKKKKGGQQMPEKEKNRYDSIIENIFDSHYSANKDSFGFDVPPL